ncbi:hypothetical protein [Methylobacterium sp. Leaf117]|uniref:hypothetical protein n=1 Tax=Methylobacterium sp. Leaf117 TaxID=1736260 RepID=UPI0006FF0025|nr:hypothetical protein [Methylobacterium sp. Leaf117]KQP79256.1 hypothetical protein ASF57_18825 [Methylobacterium sp. Leaf117]
MSARVRIMAASTDTTRLLVMEAHGSDAATTALFTAALAFMSGRPGDQGPSIVAPPSPTITPPKKARRRRT